MRLEERLQEAEQQVRVLENTAARAGQEVRENSSNLAQRDAELLQLREAFQSLESERMAAVKRCDEVRAELLYVVEQQQQESDKMIHQKDKEIEALRSSLNSVKSQTDKSSKKNVGRYFNNILPFRKRKLRKTELK